MKCKPIVLLMTCVALALSAGTVKAQERLAGICQEIRTPDASVQASAIADLKKRFSDDPHGTTSDIEKSRLPDLLMAAHLYGDAAQVCLLCVNAQPDRMDWVQYFMPVRVRAFLAAQQYEQALAAAKALYNVQDLREMPATIKLLADALAQARPEDPGIGQRFKLQQMILASAPRALDASNGSLGGNLLGTVKIDATIYDGKGMTPRSAEWRKLADGNLALMKDQPADALRAFESLKKSSNLQIRQAAEEAIARALKARDGGLSAANDYLAANP